MATIRPEVTGRSGADVDVSDPNLPPKKKRRAPVLPPSAMTIPEFCDRHRISVAFFYLLRERKQAPRVMELGHRRLITVEEAARWRDERMAASAVGDAASTEAA